MNVTIEEWTKAIPARHSRRRYDGVPLTGEQREALEAHCETFTVMEGARAVFVAEPSLDPFRGIIGGYGKVKGAPSVLLFVADTEAAEHAAATGYVGEAAVLEATRLGLGTCWISGTFDRRRVRRLTDLGPSEKVFAVSPVGTPVEEKTGPERLMAAGAGSRKRKTLTEIAPGIDSGRWPAWAFEGVTKARLAPSAVNRQPWRFRLEDEGATVVMSVEAEGGRWAGDKRLDCGIAMLHFELGALSSGVLGGWDFLAAPDVARFRVMREEGDGGRS